MNLRLVFIFDSRTSDQKSINRIFLEADTFQIVIITKPNLISIFDTTQKIIWRQNLHLSAGIDWSATKLAYRKNRKQTSFV